MVEAMPMKIPEMVRPTTSMGMPLQTHWMLVLSYLGRSGRGGGAYMDPMIQIIQENWMADRRE